MPKHPDRELLLKSMYCVTSDDHSDTCYSLEQRCSLRFDRWRDIDMWWRHTVGSAVNTGKRPLRLFSLMSTVLRVVSLAKDSGMLPYISLCDSCTVVNCCRPSMSCGKAATMLLYDKSSVCFISVTLHIYNEHYVLLDLSDLWSWSGLWWSKSLTSDSDTADLSAYWSPAALQ